MSELAPDHGACCGHNGATQKCNGEKFWWRQGRYFAVENRCFWKLTKINCSAAFDSPHLRCHCARCVLNFERLIDSAGWVRRIYFSTFLGRHLKIDHFDGPVRFHATSRPSYVPSCYPYKPSARKPWLTVYRAHSCIEPWCLRNQKTCSRLNVDIFKT